MIEAIAELTEAAEVAEADAEIGEAAAEYAEENGLSTDLTEVDKPIDIRGKENMSPEDVFNRAAAETPKDAAEVKNAPIQQKIDGLRREQEVLSDLEQQYPENEGYSIQSEAYLRDANGKIVKDPVTGEARRIDYVVTKDEEVVDSIEVTSETADKTGQIAKEQRIRENGGNYIRDAKGNLLEIGNNINTRIERRP